MGYHDNYLPISKILFIIYYVRLNNFLYSKSNYTRLIAQNEADLNRNRIFKFTFV